MSNRPITEDDLHAYVDRVLEPERQADVTAYLQAHADVAKRVAGFADQRDLLRAALAPIADEPLPQSSIWRGLSRPKGGVPGVLRGRSRRRCWSAPAVLSAGSRALRSRRHPAGSPPSPRRPPTLIMSTHRIAPGRSKCAHPILPSSCNGSPIGCTSRSRCRTFRHQATG